jgi:hypothetical protein
MRSLDAETPFLKSRKVALVKDSLCDTIIFTAIVAFGLVIGFGKHGLGFGSLLYVPLYAASIGISYFLLLKMLDIFNRVFKTFWGMKKVEEKGELNRLGASRDHDALERTLSFADYANASPEVGYHAVNRDKYMIQLFNERMDGQQLDMPIPKRWIPILKRLETICIPYKVPGENGVKVVPRLALLDEKLRLWLRFYHNEQDHDEMYALALQFLNPKKYL